MDRDEYADMFRFPMGACVHWAEQPHTRYYVSQRRWTRRNPRPDRAVSLAHLQAWHGVRQHRL